MKNLRDLVAHRRLVRAHAGEHLRRRLLHGVELEATLDVALEHLRQRVVEALDLARLEPLAPRHRVERGECFLPRRERRQRQLLAPAVALPQPAAESRRAPASSTINGGNDPQQAVRERLGRGEIVDVLHRRRQDARDHHRGGVALSVSDLAVDWTMNANTGSRCRPAWKPATLRW